jgi:hypothetical protein
MCTAQSSADVNMQYPVKGYVIVKNERLKIAGFSYADSSHLLLFVPGSNVVNGVYTYKGDIRTMQRRTIAINDLQLFKVKRQSFVKGAGITGLAGFGIGYLAGSVSYNDDFSLTDDENERRKKNRQLVSSIAVSVPAALVGGLAGGIFIKKRFHVDGNSMQLQKAIAKIYK